MTEITLLDGGLGQELQKRSRRPAHPLWSLQVMREQPQLVQAVHEDFIRAGARVVTLNTYAATPARLARDGERERMRSPLTFRALAGSLVVRAPIEAEETA